MQLKAFFDSVCFNNPTKKTQLHNLSTAKGRETIRQHIKQILEEMESLLRSADCFEDRF